jgi:hypothetical protein
MTSVLTAIDKSSETPSSILTELEGVASLVTVRRNQ